MIGLRNFRLVSVDARGEKREETLRVSAWEAISTQHSAQHNWKDHRKWRIGSARNIRPIYSLRKSLDLVCLPKKVKCGYR